MIISAGSEIAITAWAGITHILITSQDACQLRAKLDAYFQYSGKITLGHIATILAGGYQQAPAGVPAYYKQSCQQVPAGGGTITGRFIRGVCSLPREGYWTLTLCLDAGRDTISDADYAKETGPTLMNFDQSVS